MVNLGLKLLDLSDKPILDGALNMKFFNLPVVFRLAKRDKDALSIAVSIPVYGYSW